MKGYSHSNEIFIKQEVQKDSTRRSSAEGEPTSRLGDSQQHTADPRGLQVELAHVPACVPLDHWTHHQRPRPLHVHLRHHQDNLILLVAFSFGSNLATRYSKSFIRMGYMFFNILKRCFMDYLKAGIRRIERCASREDVQITVPHPSHLSGSTSLGSKLKLKQKRCMELTSSCVREFSVKT